MQRLVWASFLMTVFCFASCSDGDTDNPKKDGGGSVADSQKKDRSWSTLDDTGTVIKKDLLVQLGDLPTTVGDQTIFTGDLPQGDQNCATVFGCAKQCTNADTTCLPGCLAKGCGSTTDTVIQDFYSCAMGICSSDCISSFSSACETCLTTNCSSQLAACMSHSC